jgi:hypothetical protein
MNSFTQRKSLIVCSLMSLLFGAIFFALEGVIRSVVIVALYGCCERCSNILYDRSQPVLALCAVFACLRYLCKTAKTSTVCRRLGLTVALTWASFLGYFIFMGVTIYHRMECTALYSPGPGMMKSWLIGGPIVGLVVFVETSFWATLCTLFLVTVGEPWFYVFRQAEPPPRLFS